MVVMQGYEGRFVSVAYFCHNRRRLWEVGIREVYRMIAGCLCVSVLGIVPRFLARTSLKVVELELLPHAKF